MSESLIPLAVPSLKGNELKYVSDCIETEWVSSVGSYVDRFEADVAAFLGQPNAIACMNGTAALHIALLVSGVGIDDEVIVPTLSFIAAANVVRYVGAQPIFFDCDNYLNISVEKIRAFIDESCELTANGLLNKISGKLVKAIIPVHVFGHPADMDALTDLASQYRLKIIEDSTEALGSYYKNSVSDEIQYAGTRGSVGCLSFNGNKLVTAGGGGMLLTSSDDLAGKARHLTTQAKSDNLYLKHDQVGYNYRMTNLQAAVGVAQFEQVEQFIELKRSNFKKYFEGLIGLPWLRLIEEPEYAHSNYWYYALVVSEHEGRNRDDLMAYLQSKNIQTRPVWDLLHRQAPYQSCFAYQIEDAELYREQILNLPCSVSLTDYEVQRVVGEIRKFYGLS